MIVVIGKNITISAGSDVKPFHALVRGTCQYAAVRNTAYFFYPAGYRPFGMTEHVIRSKGVGTGIMFLQMAIGSAHPDVTISSKTEGGRFKKILRTEIL